MTDCIVRRTKIATSLAYQR